MTMSAGSRVSARLGSRPGIASRAFKLACGEQLFEPVNFLESDFRQVELRERPPRPMQINNLGEIARHARSGDETIQPFSFHALTAGLSWASMALWRCVASPWSAGLV